MVHLELTAAGARATAALIAAPDRRTDRASRLNQGGAPFAAEDDGGCGAWERRHQRDRRETATVRSAHIRTPAIGTDPLSARTAAPSLAWSMVR